MHISEHFQYYREYVAAFIAGGAGFATGVAFGWTNSPMSFTKDGQFVYNSLTIHMGAVSVSDRIWHANTGFSLTTLEFSAVVSSLNLGAFIASIPSGFFVDAIGRKATLLLVFGPYILGWLLLLASTDAILLCIGRSVLGIAAATSSVVGPVYMYEVSQKEIRGIILGFFKLEMTMGILFVNVMGTFLTTLSLLLTCLLVHFVLFIPMIFIPETPLFLVWSNQRIEAERSLKWLRGEKYDTTEELHEIEINLKKMRAFDLRPVSFWKNLQKHAAWKALFISLTLVALLQMSAVNVIIMFSTSIFGFSNGGMNPRSATIILCCEYAVVTFVSIIVVHKYGRRLLLLISTTAILVFHMILGAFFYCLSQNIAVVSTMSWAPLTCLSVIVIAFALGLGTVPWIMISELFPPNLRGPATSIAIATFWLSGCLANIAAATVKRLFGIGVTFWMFGGFQLFALLFIYFVVPETRDKSSAEIMDMLTNNKLYQ